MTPAVQLTAAGLYCPAGDFHIDPVLPVPRAVITHAHGDHARRGMGHYWATRSSEGLLRLRLGRQAPITTLPYGAPFTMGGVTVSLHPAGHLLGSAQVRIAAAEGVTVVSGDYKREPDPSCEPFEVMPCDCFVTEATFAQPQFRWPATATVIESLLDWWQQCREQGRSAVLFCYALGKAQRVLAELHRHAAHPLLREAPPVWLHPAMTPLVHAYRSAGIALWPTQAVGAPPRGFSFAGQLVLAPPGARGTPWMRRLAPHSTALASGWMVEGARHRRGYDTGFALSDHADWPALLQTITDTGAQRLRCWHGDSTALVMHCRAQGLDAADLVSG